MRGLFDNILILIPIAIFIASRVIGAMNRQNKKNQNVRPSAVPQKTPAKKPPAIKKIPVPVKQEIKRTAKAHSDAKPVETAYKTQTAVPSAAVKSKPDIQKAAELPQPGQAAVFIQKLPPLQQALVWSELLGQPKGIQ